VTPKATTVTALVLSLTAARTASAQRLLVGAGVGVGSGIERSDVSEERPMRIARTRIIVPIELRIDEDPKQGLGVTGLFEIEPRVSAGADLRYIRWFGGNVTGFVGVTGVLAPETLFGVDLGIDFYLPKRPAAFSLFLEPSLAAMVLGSDLPDDHVLLWALIAVGVHGDL
jgi:hypothetical protein